MYGRKKIPELEYAYMIRASNANVHSAYWCGEEGTKRPLRRGRYGYVE
jgi:hypothetical protein